MKKAVWIMAVLLCGTGLSVPTAYAAETEAATTVSIAETTADTAESETAEAGEQDGKESNKKGMDKDKKDNRDVDTFFEAHTFAENVLTSEMGKRMIDGKLPIPVFQTERKYTVKSPENPIRAKNLEVSTISVSCLKVTWEADKGRQYTVSVDFVEGDEGYMDNVYFEFKSNHLLYLTGLRENTKYRITVTPLLKEGETEDDVTPLPTQQTGVTEAVESIWDFECEDGWTSCFAGERASGLTRYPSRPAISGSVADPVTRTGIRRNAYGDYCCAMGLWYGVVGDRFLVELDNGIQFTVAICDSKGWADDADGDEVPDGRFHWFGGEGCGKCVIEFIYDDYSLPSCVAYSGSWGYWNWYGLNLASNIKSIQKLKDYGERIEY